jgi:hypothetical protein
MSYEFAIIPLDHLSSADAIALRQIHFRGFASKELETVLQQIAGHGKAGLWWSEAEAIAHLDRGNHGWAWTPCGQVDVNAPFSQRNAMTHMKIFFKYPGHALLFKLTWL